MKTFKYLGLFLVSLCLLTACTEEDVDEVLALDHTGGLIEVISSSLNYVVGNDAAYPVNLVAFHGSNPIQTIEVYKTYSTSTGESSNTEFLKTIELTGNGNKEAVTFSVTYEELIEGLTIEGNPVPSDDTQLNIGDGFTLTYVAFMASGDSSSSRAKTKLTVSTRYAGQYRTIAAEYFRLGILTYSTADWPAATTIESVDAITYHVVEYFGAAAFSGNSWYFQVQPDLTITYPAEWNGVPQTGNGQPFITCQSNPADLAPVHCGSSNYVQQDDVNGADRLYMSYGYLTPGSGPRAFYQVLEKIVD